MKINTDIVKQSAEYVSRYLTDKLPEEYCYHNLSHTTSVVQAVNYIADGVKLPEHERCILQCAAWFHDLGYVWQMEEHETAAAHLAEKFLESKSIDTHDIRQVKDCIMATRYPQRPSGLLQQIICDADMIHLGKKDFFEKNASIREEWNLTRKQAYTDAQWHELNISFMSHHFFHTAYCQKNHNRQKKKNISLLEKLLKEEKGQEVKDDYSNKPKQEKNELTKKEKSERGIETLFKTAARNHMQLSSMADSKAHILLSINSIIISVIISVLGRRLEQSPYLILPTITLLLVCLSTMVFAVLTTQPKISSGVFTKEQVAKREANLMFFGNFHNMDIKTYEWGVKEIMNDRDYLYSSMTRDVYYLGKVLAIKYRYLNIGYKIFMFGLIAAVAAFGIGFSLAF